MLTAFVLVVNGVLNSLLKASLILSLRVQRARPHLIRADALLYFGCLALKKKTDTGFFRLKAKHAFVLKAVPV